MRKLKVWQGVLHCRALTPIVIGSGDPFEAIDFYIDERTKKFRALDILNWYAQSDIPEARKLDILLNRETHKISKWHYELEYISYGKGKPQRVMAFIKDGYARPYIPASSIKGSLRHLTLLFLQKPPETRAELHKFNRYDYEKKLLGNDMHNDSFRALQISDSPPIPMENLLVLPYGVASLRGNTLRVDSHRWFYTEALKPETTWTHTISLDATGNYHKSHEELKDGQSWFQKMKKEAEKLIGEEKNFYEEHPFFPDNFPVPMAKHFEEWEKRESLILPLGFGTGWHTKTLEMTERAQRYVRQRSRLGRGPIFPKTRKIAAVKPADRRFLPLGWVEITWEVKP